jgi:predicted kinase
MKPRIYAMVGTIGSGKTTYATKLALEKSAVLFCIDESIKLLNQPVKSKEDYDKYYYGVRAIITNLAIKTLNLGVSVVFDFGGNRGHWEWLQDLALKGEADIEIFHLKAPKEVRRERVRQRNTKQDVIFYFSDADFDTYPTESAAPTPQQGLIVTEIQTN